MKQLHNASATSAAPSRAGVDGAFERLFELAARLGDLMGQGLAARGLSMARAEVIWVLRRQGPATQRELAQALRCTPRNVTGLLDALQTAGLVARGPHPTDRRATLVTLTDAGTTLAADWHAGYQQSASQLFDGVSGTDLDTFVAVLDLVLGRLSESAPAADNAD